MHSVWRRFVNSVSILSSDSDSNSDNMLWVMFHVDFPKLSPFPFITHERNSEPVFHLPHAVVGRRFPIQSAINGNRARIVHIRWPRSSYSYSYGYSLGSSSSLNLSCSSSLQIVAQVWVRNGEFFSWNLHAAHREVTKYFLGSPEVGPVRPVAVTMQIWLQPQPRPMGRHTRVCLCLCVLRSVYGCKTDTATPGATCHLAGRTFWGLRYHRTHTHTDTHMSWGRTLRYELVFKIFHFWLWPCAEPSRAEPSQAASPVLLLPHNNGHSWRMISWTAPDLDLHLDLGCGRRQTAKCNSWH